MKLSLLLAAGVGVAALAASAIDRQPTLVWNATASAPVGLYRIITGQPRRGALALMRLPEPFRTLAHLRGYVPGSVPVIKPIAAMPGDIMCRHGRVVTINGRFITLARHTDHADRPLPSWRGCRLLGGNAVGLISSHPHSFDGRYFGSLDRRHVVGLAIPIWNSNTPGP